VAALAPLLDAAEASQQVSSAARPVLDTIAQSHDSNALRSLAGAVAALAPRLDAAEASTAARRVLDAMAKTNNSNALRSLAEAVAALAVHATPEETIQRTRLLANVVGQANCRMRLLADLPLLSKAAQPLPGRFTEQELVDLLKMLSCQRPAREVIVRQLGQQCGQHFANVWEFVEWAREHRPDLDLNSPPVRPTLPGNQNPHD
jgi:hypothetical protein